MALRSASVLCSRHAALRFTVSMSTICTPLRANRDEAHIRAFGVYHSCQVAAHRELLTFQASEQKPAVTVKQAMLVSQRPSSPWILENIGIAALSLVTCHRERRDMATSCFAVSAVSSPPIGTDQPCLGSLVLCEIATDAIAWLCP